MVCIFAAAAVIDYNICYDLRRIIKKKKKRVLTRRTNACVQVATAENGGSEKES